MAEEAVEAREPGPCARVLPAVPGFLLAWRLQYCLALSREASRLCPGGGRGPQVQAIRRPWHGLPAWRQFGKTALSKVLPRTSVCVKCLHSGRLRQPISGPQGTRVGGAGVRLLNGHVAASKVGHALRMRDDGCKNVVNALAWQ